MVSPEFFQRMALAAPRVKTWIDELVAAHTPRSRPVADAGFPRLHGYFPKSVLDDVRVVTVKRIPFVPFADFGLAEFANLEQMAVSGVTYAGLCFVHESMLTESVCFHEIVHALQWKTLGWKYLLTYGVGLIEHGYARSPLEAMAFDFQSAFDRGEPAGDIPAQVEARTLEAGAHAAAYLSERGVVFESSGG